MYVHWRQGCMYLSSLYTWLFACVFYEATSPLLKWLWSEDGCNDINNHVNEEVVYDYVLSVVYIRDREDKK